MGYNVKANSVSQPTPNPQPEKRKERKPDENKPEKKFYDKINIDLLSVKELKDILRKLAVNTDACFERIDLVKKYNEWYKSAFGVFPHGYKETKEPKKAEPKKAEPTPTPQPTGNANNGMNADSKINVKQFDPSLG